MNYIHKSGILKISENTKVLEIGFESGGVSIFAFEKLGLKTIGIDNLYNLKHEKELWTPEINHNYNFFKSKAILKYGDITKKTTFNENSIDIIYSASVLEHIQSLDKAFKECYRILKPGGIMIHSYHPFYSYNGGHALCIPDYPWGHILLKKNEYKKYLKRYRPYESDTAIKYLEKALSYENSQKNVQLKLLCSGFHILNWRNLPTKHNNIKDLSSEIILECLKINKELSIEDLITQNINFIAKKRP